MKKNKTKEDKEDSTISMSSVYLGVYVLLGVSILLVCFLNIRLEYYPVVKEEIVEIMDSGYGREYKKEEMLSYDCAGDVRKLGEANPYDPTILFVGNDENKRGVCIIKTNQLELRLSSYKND